MRRLLVASAPEFVRRPLTRVAEGWDNVTWRLGTDLAVRLPRRAAAAALIAHEQQALPQLAPRLAAVGIRTPVPVVRGAPDDRFPWPWSIVPWIPGASALAQPRTDATQWAEALAAALRALHVPAPADAPVNPVRGVPLAVRDDGIRDRLDRLELTAPDLARGLREIWRRGLEAPATVERVWIHGDLHPGNILVAAGRLTALIDFGDVTAGDPAYDLGVAWLAFDGAGRERFRVATAGRYDAPTWTRARAWAAALAVILLDASDDREDFRALGNATAAELLDDGCDPADRVRAGSAAP